VSIPPKPFIPGRLRSDSPRLAEDIVLEVGGTSTNAAQHQAISG
jgi:hypothetical protein